MLQCRRTGEQLGDRIPLILDSGETGGMLSSTIVNLVGDDWQIVREGVISEDQIKQVLEG